MQTLTIKISTFGTKLAAFSSNDRTIYYNRCNPSGLFGVCRMENLLRFQAFRKTVLRL